MTVQLPLIIVGGGLAGSLGAVTIRRQNPDQPLLLLESGADFGGVHTWSCFDSDVAGPARGLLDDLAPLRLDKHQVLFGSRTRELAIGYNTVRGGQLDALVRRSLSPTDYRLHAPVLDITPGGVTLAGGEYIAASGVIDARGPQMALPGLDLAWQKFVGIDFRVPGHGITRPVIMDATVDQIDGYRFVYVLPLTPDSLLVEDTYFSDNPHLDVPLLAGRVADYAREHGWGSDQGTREHGVLPIVLGGKPALFWPQDDPIPRLGMIGGFFNPTTSYSLPMALANAVALGQQRDLSTAALAAWSRGRFLAAWKKDGFFRMLNRMSFRAATADGRRRIFDHFYRLDQGLIGRFYAGNLRQRDKLRIVTGKPPVPISKAIAAILGATPARQEDGR